MNASETALAMGFLFLLLLAFPLVATAIFGYAMNHLVDYWIANSDR